MRLVPGLLPELVVPAAIGGGPFELDGVNKAWWRSPKHRRGERERLFAYFTDEKPN